MSTTLAETQEGLLRGESAKILSLFSGCGGLDEGFVQAGFSIGDAYELNRSAAQSYASNLGKSSKRLNFGGANVFIEDLSLLDPKIIVDRWRLNHSEALTGIIGGPPCQAFSIGNTRQRADDPRAQLIINYSRILKTMAEAFQPQFFVLENVPHLCRPPHRAILDEFAKVADSAGYSVSEHFLNAQDFDVPQYRARVFIVGIRKDIESKPFKTPESQSLTRKTVFDAINGLPEPALHVRGLQPDATWFHPNHWAPNPKSRKFYNGALTKGPIKGRSFRVLSWSKPSWTVAYGHREVHVHPNERRRLSVYEAMLLQGFPSNFVLEGSISHQISQVSEAVPPPLARVMAMAVKDYLGLASWPDSSIVPAKDI